MSRDDLLAVCMGFMLGALLGSTAGLGGAILGGMVGAIVYVTLLPYANREDELEP